MVIGRADHAESETQRILALSIFAKRQDILHRAQRVVMPGGQEATTALPGVEPLFGLGPRYRKKSGCSETHRRVQLSLPGFALPPLALRRRQVLGLAAGAD